MTDDDPETKKNAKKRISKLLLLSCNNVVTIVASQYKKH